MLTSSQTAAVIAAAHAIGIAPAVLLAIIEIESGGRVLARVGGRDEPLIRWEGHYFDRLCAPALRERARALSLASPRAGAIANPPGQAARWALFERAERIDRVAARSSVSWGVGQVMGAHWRWLGYASVDALVAAARSGLAGQLALMLRYIDKAGLVPALQAEDWERFARGYNGPAYARNAYHTRLASAFRRHSAVLGGSGAVTLLRRGARGEAVADLQRRLVASGAAIAVDGIFGALTEAALRAFQKAQGLAIDGIAGPATLSALDAHLPARPPTGLLPVLLGHLARLLAVMRPA